MLGRRPEWCKLGLEEELCDERTYHWGGVSNRCYHDIFWKMNGKV